jgi:hypothetical protein
LIRDVKVFSKNADVQRFNGATTFQPWIVRRETA